MSPWGRSCGMTKWEWIQPKITKLPDNLRGGDRDITTGVLPESVRTVNLRSNYRRSPTSSRQKEVILVGTQDIHGAANPIGLCHIQGGNLYSEAGTTMPKKGNELKGVPRVSWVLPCLWITLRGTIGDRRRVWEVSRRA